MKSFTILSILYFNIFTLAYSQGIYSNSPVQTDNVFNEKKEFEDGIIIDEKNSEVIVEAYLNTRYFRAPTKLIVVFREGFNAKYGLFISNASPTTLFAGLLRISAMPGDNLTMESIEGMKTDGSKLEVSIEWNEDKIKRYSLDELIHGQENDSFDIRFSGNLENSENFPSGSLLSLVSSPLCITCNANVGMISEKKNIYWNLDKNLFPPNGWPIKIIFKLIEVITADEIEDEEKIDPISNKIEPEKASLDKKSQKE